MLLQKLKKTNKKYSLIQANDRILVGFSGGPDSTALVLLLLELKEELPFQIYLAHFNHKLRKEADKDEKHVREFAKKYSLPLIVGCENVKKYAKSHHKNIEEAGRELRYNFLKEEAKKINANKIALGHTLTDEAETVLMRIIRGTGLKGLTGIHPVKEKIFIRPLIEIEKEEILSYLKLKKINYCLDKTNFDTRYLRNRVRLQLIPFLKERFNPKIISQLGKLSELIREDEKILEKIAHQEYQRIITEKNSKVLLDVSKLSNYSSGLQRRILRNFIEEIKGDLRSINFKHIQSLLELKENKETHLTKNLKIRRENNKLFLADKKKKEKKEYFYYLNANEKIFIRECGLKFKTSIISSFEFNRLKFNDSERAYLDFEKLDFPLLVRNRKEGDSYQPLGAPGRKKLKEIMRAKKIPLEKRKFLPIFLSKDKIIWVPGCPVSEDFKVKSSTSKILLIEKAN